MVTNMILFFFTAAMRAKEGDCVKRDATFRNPCRVECRGLVKSAVAADLAGAVHDDVGGFETAALFVAFHSKAAEDCRSPRRFATNRAPLVL